MKGSSPTPDTEIPSRARAFHFRNAPVLLLVCLAALGTFVVTPRPTRPRIFPLPTVDAVSLRARETEEQRLAQLGSSAPLDIAIRTVGEELRRLHGTERVGWDDAASLQTQLQRDVQALLAQGRQAELRTLRALQAELFVRAVHEAWTPGEPARVARGERELRELAGPFLELARASYAAPSGELSLSDDDLRLFFRVHWGRLTGVHRMADFGPTLEEFRRYYSLQLRYPQGGSALDPRSRAAVRLQAVRAISEMDRAYPADLAQGLLLLEAGFPAEANVSLGRHMQAYPDGPWAVVARNARLAAVRASDW